MMDLPKVRGRYTFSSPLSESTWFKVGGLADVIFRPTDEDDLSYFLKNKPKDIPISILGAGSNVLVHDEGIPGIVIRLTRGFGYCTVMGNNLHVGGGCLDRNVALTAQMHGLDGFSFLVGIPGSMGGAVKMNAGAYGREMKDVIESVHLIDPDGKQHQWGKEELGLTYRHSTLPEGWIVTSVYLKGQPGDPSKLQEEIQKFLDEREATQPVQGRTGGSTFKNPPGQKAWQLIDQAGCRGLRHGDAMVSEKHCNFFLNLDQATANDLESLGEDVRQRVLAKTGISLEWEIMRIGGRSHV